MQSQVTSDTGLCDIDDFQFSLSDMPFGRKLSYLSVSQAELPTECGKSLQQLYISKLTKRYYTSKLPDEPTFPGLILLRPYQNGASLDFTTIATPSLLRANTRDGSLELCFDSQDVLRIRGSCVGLRIYAPLKEHEAAIDRLDGTYQVSLFDGAGEFLIVPTKGRHCLYSQWDWQKAGTDNLLIDILPDEDGTFEASIHYAVANTHRHEAYRPFDACVEEAAADFRNWYAMYPQVPKRFEHTKRISTYAIWTCFVGPLNKVKGNVLMFDKQNSAFCWHSAFNAMPIINNPEMAVNMLLTVFDYQDEYGQIPDLIDDRYVNYLATKPPYQGAALIFLMDRLGERLTEEHCERLYEPLSRWYTWWMTMRDTDNDGVPQYNQGCESGFDCSEALARGVPVECPDIIAYIILLAEALGRLAERTHRSVEEVEWFKRSQELLQTLINSFWDGQRFVARVSSSHEVVDIPGVQAYSPIMLGHRLPHNILNTICERLDKDIITDHGLLSYSRCDPDAPPYNYYSGFDQITTAIGLVDAGKTELAKRLIRGYCNENAEHLPRMGYIYGQRPEKAGIRTELFYEDYGKCSSLSSGIFLVLSGLLNELGD